ncbi:MAG: PadR family transcriptional regulator [Sporolactobacillus sp.]
MQGRDVVLGLLNQRSRTGYEIKEILETQLSYFFEASIGMIYPTLRKLEKEGKIKKDRVYQTDKPNKNVYSITQSGKDEFDHYLKSPTSEELYRSDFLMRLYFGKYLSKDELVQIISQEIDRKKHHLDWLSSEYEKWRKNGMNKLQTITYHYGMAYYAAEMDVLTMALNDVQNDD